MDLYQLRYFLAIAETSSFTKAAERLFVSQPSLSAGIKKLEQELGVVLFERGGRKVLLTSAGHFFLEKAQNILQEYQSTLDAFKSFKDRPTLRLGTLHTMRGYNLARLIGAYRQQHPNVTIELYNSHLEELDDWLEQGKIDLAITSLGDREASKTCQKLFQQKLLLAVSPEHPFAQRSSIHLADLEGEPLIERIHCEIWRAYPQMFEEAGFQPQIVYWADNEEWVISLVRVGLGVSIMPVWQGLTDVNYVPIADANFNRTIGLKWRSQQESEAVDWFRVFATSHDWQV
ncbi:MAG: LysR family transcriptional regulator [Pleurocapsa sp. MO_226.B13]|nr:LysR family transcriptional regulator [Pleurocapsa sp. MO_226.B13]